MAALRYGFFIEFLSPRATADLKRLDDEVSWFVCLPNITALSVAGLVSQSAAQQGPSDDGTFQDRGFHRRPHRPLPFTFIH
jgi:hypothetical protein